MQNYCHVVTIDYWIRLEEVDVNVLVRGDYTKFTAPRYCGKRQDKRCCVDKDWLNRWYEVSLDSNYNRSHLKKDLDCLCPSVAFDRKPDQMSLHDHVQSENDNVDKQKAKRGGQC